MWSAVTWLICVAYHMLASVGVAGLQASAPALGPVGHDRDLLLVNWLVEVFHLDSAFICGLGLQELGDVTEVRGETESTIGRVPCGARRDRNRASDAAAPVSDDHAQGWRSHGCYCSS